MRRSTLATAPPTPPAPEPRFAAGLGVAQGPCLRPTIGTVNGQTKGTVFTPDPQFNQYTIQGCKFGDTQGQAYIYGPFAAGQVALQIEFWSDTQIVAKVNPQVTGELDQNNVTLVVVPSGAPMVQKTGFKFYAMRETTLLAKIPRSMLDLRPLTDETGSPVVQVYSSPAGQGLVGMSAGIERSSPGLFLAGNDYYDFKDLKPGFFPESVQVKYYPLPGRCNVYFVERGTWYTEWKGDSGLVVGWMMQHCHQSYSYYGLSVWVSGPRGVSPGVN